MTVIGLHFFETFKAPKFKTPDKDLAPNTNQIGNFSGPFSMQTYPLLNQEIPVDENHILVEDNILSSAVQLPSNSPLKASILSPYKEYTSAKLSSVVSRFELVQNCLDQVDNRIDLL
jgi:hypothetical protein